MHRYFVTGTDTDVGKTRVCAALACALRNCGEPATVLKLVQTGLPGGVPGDAQLAGTLAEVPFLELARFPEPADPWSAALAAGVAPIRAACLARAVDGVAGSVLVEGSGGLLVPLNEEEHLGDVARLARLRVVLVVGLRLGCLNHALLTLAACEQLELPPAGICLVERWGDVGPRYRADVVRTLQGKARLLGILPFADDEAAAVGAAARLFRSTLET